MLDSNEKRPLYLQLADVLLTLIQEQLHTDDKIPTEKELCEEYAVSRTTVRQALSELQRRGIIYRVQGGGSYVAPSTTTCSNSLFDFGFESHCTLGPVDSFSKESHIEALSGANAFSLMQQFGITNANDIVRLSTTYKNEATTVAQDIISINRSNLTTPVHTPQDAEALLAEAARNIASVRETYTTRIISLTHEPQAILVIERSAYDTTGTLQVLLERALYSSYINYQNFGFSS